MKKTIINFILVLIVFAISSCSTKSVNREMCPNIFIDSPDEIKFSDTEKLLICGDPGDEAYKVIPVYQAKFMLQGFLQSRGYSSPRFVYEENILRVYTEDKSHLNNISVKAESNTVDTKRFEKEILRRFRNDEITPDLLDEIEAKARSMARNESYPCATVSSIAEPKEGKVTVTFAGLQSFTFGDLTRGDVPGLDPAAFLRFTTFSSDEPFSEDDLLLTEKRFLRQGVVQGTFFKESCDLKKNQFSLSQDFIIGPPRTIHFGAGASTELGPVARVRWTHQRFGDMASVLSARLEASLKNQRINLRAEQFLWKSSPRRSLNTNLSYERNDQDDFLETTTTLNPTVEWTRDSRSRFWLWGAGPSFIASTYKTNLFGGDRSFKTAAILGVLQSKTHSFELFDIHPETGEFYQFNFDFRHPSMGFTDPLIRFDLSFLKLFWLGSFGKGSSILGVRLNGGTTWVKNETTLRDLPPSVKHYGGGSDDMRGFKLNSLPDNLGLGALSKMSLKLEFRKTHFFDPNLEGFTFIDSTFFGDRPWSVESRLWYSPGAGLRWFSPIGLVQTYLARSLSNESSINSSQDEGFLFFLGIGGVF